MVVYLDPVPLKLLELPQRDVGAAAPFSPHQTASYRNAGLAGKRAAKLLAKAHLQMDQRDGKTCETDEKAPGR
jgi:hypothetical protein